MRADPTSIAYPPKGIGSSPLGHWPEAGIFSIAYRLANLRVSRLGTLFGISLVFFLA